MKRKLLVAAARKVKGEGGSKSETASEGTAAEPEEDAQSEHGSEGSGKGGKKGGQRKKDDEGSRSRSPRNQRTFERTITTRIPWKAGK